MAALHLIGHLCLRSWSLTHHTSLSPASFFHSQIEGAMAMESGEQRMEVEPLNVNGQVKQEVGAEETMGGGGGGATVAAGADDASMLDITIRCDMTLLHCHVCMLPLKPPVFACDAAGHVACASCHGMLQASRCHACPGVYGRCGAMDAVVRGARIPCPYGRHGCPSYVAYHEPGNHQRVCPYAHCFCKEPGCGFAGGPPAALLAHLTTAHSWPVRGVRYGKVLTLHLPVSERRLLLVEEGDGRVFLLSVYAPGPACRAVPLVCVRANGAAGPPYACKLWADGPRDAATGKEDNLLMDVTVTSSASPGKVAMEEVTFLAVPPVMQHGDDEASKQMHLRVRIDKTSF